MIHHSNPLSMQKNKSYTILGLASCLFVATTLSLCAQTTDTMQVAQLRVELLQMQERLAKTKAKADSLQALVHSKINVDVGMGQEYWLSVLGCNKGGGPTSADLEADLIQDKLIKNESALRSYHLDSHIFRVNGRIQNPAWTQKYQQKYLSRRPNGDQTTSMTHTAGSFLGLKF